MATGGFEVFWITYQMPKFGTENQEYDPREYTMAVSTDKGRKDAEVACKKYHKNCKILHILTKQEIDSGAILKIEKMRSEEAPKKKPKKGK